VEETAQNSGIGAVGHKDAPPEVKAALQTEDGDELEIVNEQVPEQRDGRDV
jgi:hypothetical protein